MRAVIPHPKFPKLRCFHALRREHEFSAGEKSQLPAREVPANNLKDLLVAFSELKDSTERLKAVRTEPFGGSPKEKAFGRRHSTSVAALSPLRAPLLPLSKCTSATELEQSEPIDAPLGVQVIKSRFLQRKRVSEFAAQKELQRSALRTQSTWGELFSPFVLNRKPTTLAPLQNVRKGISLRPVGGETDQVKQSRLGKFVTLKLHPSKSVPVG